MSFLKYFSKKRKTTADEDNASQVTVGSGGGVVRYVMLCLCKLVGMLDNLEGHS